jgi:hypothetical protein
VKVWQDFKYYTPDTDELSFVIRNDRISERKFNAHTMARNAMTIAFTVCT